MLWIKAFHIIAVICWFAGIFYLPRLFVYHAMSNDQISNERFIVMERKLLNAIMTPSAVISVLLGGVMLIEYWPSYAGTYWIWLKLFCVALLLVFHGYCIYFVKQFALNKNTHSDKFYRIFNELPVPLLVTIIIMVIVRPF